VDALIICNDGQNIDKTNFWDEDDGQFYLSYNAGALRLLVPESQKSMIKELNGVREVIVSRGPWQEKKLSDAMEMLFEDDSEAPFSIQVDINLSDIRPPETQNGRCFMFSVWTKGNKKCKEFPAKFRTVPSIPYLRKWGK